MDLDAGLREPLGFGDNEFEGFLVRVDREGGCTVVTPTSSQRVEVDLPFELGGLHLLVSGPDNQPPATQEIDHTVLPYRIEASLNGASGPEVVMKPHRVLLPLLGVGALGLLWASASQPEPAPESAVPTTQVQPRPSQLGPSSDPWRSDRVMVSGPDLEGAAERLETSLVEAPGPSGWAAMELPPGADREVFLDELRRQGLRASPEGWIRGSGAKADARSTSSAAEASTAEVDLGGWVVAVIDSGVAYRGAEVELAGLAGLDIVEPWDFVDEDGDAYDENQHGSHIASVIASEDVDYPGVAPGVSLMPLRVLDADNLGTELDLVDAIAHATEHGADVINLSLSFGLGYAPSQALLDAIEDAHAAGVVLVAAAGNDAMHVLSWPAASPRVVAVSSASDEDAGALSSYSNGGAATTLSAFGDAVVAETIGTQDPSSSGLWSYTGTSQAAAQVSGAVVWLLEAGVSPEDVPATLQVGKGYGGWNSGLGDGVLDVDASLDATASGVELHASVLAYLVEDEVRAHVALVDGDGQAVADARVYASLQGEASATTSCKTDSQGACTLSVGQELGDDDVYVWTLGLAVVDGVGQPVLPLLYGTDGLVVWQLLAGELPWADLGESLVARRVSAPQPGFGPPWLDELLVQLLQPQPERRPEAAEVADRLAAHGFEGSAQGTALIQRRARSVHVELPQVEPRLQTWTELGGALTTLGPAGSGRRHALRWAEAELQACGRSCTWLGEREPASLAEGTEPLLIEDLDALDEAHVDQLRALVRGGRAVLARSSGRVLPGQVLELPRLDEAGVRALVAALLGSDRVPNSLVRSLQLSSLGLPGRVVEGLVRAAQAGLLRQRALRWTVDEAGLARVLAAVDLDCPELGVLSGLEERLGGLCATTTDALTRDELQGMGFAEADLHEALGELVARGLLRLEDGISASPVASRRSPSARPCACRWPGASTASARSTWTATCRARCSSRGCCAHSAGSRVTPPSRCGTRVGSATSST